MLVQVDGVLVIAPTRIVHIILAENHIKWKLPHNGILARPDAPAEFTTSNLRCLGCTVELGHDTTIRLHQICYSKEKLNDRGLDRTQGRVGLPELRIHSI